MPWFGFKRLSALSGDARKNYASSNSSDGSEKASRGEKAGFLTHVRRATTASRSSQHLYITGLRGILVLQSFLWTFFITFIPTLAASTTPGPVYQDILREILQVPLWNYSLIYNFFIILSMRTICVSFLTNPTGQTYAATVIRRVVRLVIVLCVASGMAMLIFSQIGVGFIDDFKASLPNKSIRTPAVVIDGGAAIGSLFDLFWLTRDFYTQAANTFWPTSTLWVSSVIYYQSFTVYFLMVILPFTRPKWHVQGLTLFGLGSFWMGQWGWYSATGLLLASVATNELLGAELKMGLKISKERRIPYWAVALTAASVGIAMKYAFVVRPRFLNSLLYLHPYLDLAENFSRAEYIAEGPYPRLDDWFIIVAIMTVVELFESAKFYLSFKPLVWLGERSFSIFVAQCIIFWTAGIKLWLALAVKESMSTAGANAVVFVVCTLAIVLFSELFYICVDLPSRWLAKRTYLWLVN